MITYRPAPDVIPPRIKSARGRKPDPRPIGEKFGSLTVLAAAKGNLVLCRCDCGAEKEVQLGGLKDGTIKTCANRTIHPTSVKHGHSADGNASSEYMTWGQMVQRCTNPSHARWKDYGGRGITVCQRWLSFENFFTDMGYRPEGLTLERRDNNSSYTPENCYWATYSTQAKNKRDSGPRMRDPKSGRYINGE